MAHLSLSLFGGYDILLDGIPVTTLRSSKVRALLAYLAIEAYRPRRREALAGLLWPDAPDAAASNSLRNALANLRQTLGDTSNAPTFLDITREAVRFNPAADCWSDVIEFERHIANRKSQIANRKWQVADREKLQSAICNLQSAISLYRGSFLAGFSVGSAPFEEWALYKQEQFQRQAVEALHALAVHYEACGEYATAQDFARQQLAIEPYDEETHRQLMRMLVHSGQRSAALAQYETCRRLLAAELCVEPARETTALYTQIRDGAFDKVTRWQEPALEMRPPSPPTSGGAAFPPRVGGSGGPFSSAVALNPAWASALSLPKGDKVIPLPVTLSPLHRVTPSPFVAREVELRQLSGYLAAALAGQGRAVFVTGDAGSGKTALMTEFARRAMASHAELLVAEGDCNAQANIGDPYLPFVDILQLLTGDIEAKRAGGTISPEHARRLWDAMPQALEILTEHGPDLIGRFVPGAALVLRAEDGGHSQGSWRQRLAALAERAAVPDSQQPQLPTQMRLFDQIAAVLTTLARLHPLLLILDDLQWADIGTTSLLFHLGRRLAGTRILIVGAYRPGDLVAGQAMPAQEAAAGDSFVAARHPLEPVVNELRRVFGDVAVDLDRADSRRFMDAFLDREPNRLSAGFRDAFYRHTGGHALFTVELLRGLQERGDLVRDESGSWIEGSTLNWERMPTRVEAVIAERIGRLSPRWRAWLAAASVEGEEFTAEVLAHVMKLDEPLLIQQLSGPLCKRERLVCAHSLRRLDASEQHVSRYRFQHSLFQKYLYQNLDEIERVHLHQAIGEALETLYHACPTELESLSSRLAWHFEEAGLVSKAIVYLLQAGNRATQLSASAEGIAHFTRGLKLLRTLPESPERTRQEMDLLLALGAPLLAARGWGTSERGAAFARATELSRRSGDMTDILRATALQADYCRAIGECEKSIALGEQMLELAQQTMAPVHLALAHYTFGTSLFFTGRFIPARHHLEQGIALWISRRDQFPTTLMGIDFGVISRIWLVGSLWILGYPDQALQCSQVALAEAQASAQPFTVGMTLVLASLHLAIDRGDEQAAREQLAELTRIAGVNDVPFFQMWIAIYGGWLKANTGQGPMGITEMHQGIEAWKATGTQTGRPLQLFFFAEACYRHGQNEQALAAVAEGLAVIEQIGARYYEAELHRLKGELLRQHTPGTAPDAGGAKETEACYLHAIDLARQQGARLWELRATVSLCRLWRERGRVAEARQRLDAIYSWFTEGFDTPALQKARRLLEELASDCA